MGALTGPERLAAYVDGALEPEDAAGVVMGLADSVEDRRQVDALSELNRLLAAAYAAPLAEPVPERIRRVLAPAARSQGLRLPGSLRGLLLPAGLVAAAAGLALVVGVSIGNWSSGPGQPDVGPVAGDLHTVLEGTSSGDTVALEDGREITMIASFRDGAGRFCREFEAQDDGSAQFSRGIACRDGPAAWIVAVMVSEPLADPAGSSGGYLPAAGTTDAALTGALDALGAGPSLGPSAERALIESGWTD
jgi:hypothetical protein